MTTKKTMKEYTVFVDGIEVNDYYLTLEDAILWHEDYTQDGYEPYIHQAIFDTNGAVKEYKHIPLKTDKVTQ